jgi:hypothetical protein
VHGPSSPHVPGRSPASLAGPPQLQAVSGAEVHLSEPFEGNHALSSGLSLVKWVGHEGWQCEGRRGLSLLKWWMVGKWLARVCAGVGCSKCFKFGGRALLPRNNPLSRFFWVCFAILISNYSLASSHCHAKECSPSLVKSLCA